MPFTTAKTNWVDNEIVLPEDLNRIEANVDAANKINYEQELLVVTALMGAATLTVFYEPVFTVQHTSRTGRVKLTGTITLQNPDGSDRNTYLSLARDGVNMLRNKPDGLARVYCRAGDYTCVLLDYISGDAPIGAPSEYNLLVKQAAGNVHVAAGSILIVEDI